LFADGGYYLFPECPAAAAVKLLSLNTTEQEDEDITVSLLNWWWATLSLNTYKHLPGCHSACMHVSMFKLSSTVANDNKSFQVCVGQLVVPKETLMAGAVYRPNALPEAVLSVLLW